MRHLVLAAVTVTLTCPSLVGADPPKQRRPNIILIMADDLGYGELGCYGQQKIRTPHLDQLAKEGVRFTQYYAGSPVCAPSRYVLLTGKHSGHAYIRSNREVQPEGQLPIPADTVTLSSLLRAAGYATGMIGKWGLGGPGSTGDPLRHGWQFFFGYLCQRHAHNHYPTYLRRNDQKILLEGNPGGATGKQYAHDLMEAEALEFIRKHQDQPFFLYLPFTIPHAAVQVPEDSLAEYKGKWDDPPYQGGKGYQPHPHPRAAYAAMITRMDRSIGRIVELLRQLGLEEDTVIFFTSDNGATHDGVGGTDTVFFVSNGILRGFKGSLFEGGVRVPLIVRWRGRVPAGRTSDHIAAHQDVLPTVCEIAGVKTPRDIDGLSFLPTLLHKGEQKQHPYLYFEFHGYGGQQAVRLGEWKGLRQNLHKGQIVTQLYNLALDPSEKNNVASQHPEIVARIERLMREARVPSKEFPIKVLDQVK